MTGSSPRKAPPASGQRCARFWRRRPISAVTCTSCGTRSTTYRARVDDDCLQELRWLYDRRDLPEARRDLAAWLAKWSGKYPKLTGWVEENIDETLTFYRLPRQRHSISRPGWRRTALSRRSLVRRAKGVRLVRFAPDSPLEGDGFELPLGIQPEENCGFPGLAINPKPGRSLNLPGSASDVRYIHYGSFEKGGGWRRRLASHDV
jgi:hypothetical protein